MIQPEFKQGNIKVNLIICYNDHYYKNLKM